MAPAEFARQSTAANPVICQEQKPWWEVSLYDGFLTQMRKGPWSPWHLMGSRQTFLGHQYSKRDHQAFLSAERSNPCADGELRAAQPVTGCRLAWLGMDGFGG